MKSELIVQDFQGVHNSNKEITGARLLKGGSWKRQRIAVILPADTLIPAKVALSHWNLAFPPNNGVIRILAQGMEVGHAYSSAIEGILGHPELSTWEYILTLEHDNMPPADGVLKLLEQMEAHPELSAIGGLYFTKGEGGVAQIWGDPKDSMINFRPQVPDLAGGLVECCGVAMGFTLFRISMFKDARLRKPWFLTQKEGGIATQDLYFWGDARKFGYRCGIDCSVKVGHYEHATDTCW
ncbi:MAG: hypothetical protein ACREIQ_06625, partial [Nitrospiria bacterium]